MATANDIKSQLQHLRRTGFADHLAHAALGVDLPVPYLYAIASRETNCVNRLGDFRDGQYHGVGIMQIDIQHPIARAARDNGSWRVDSQALIDFGAHLLLGNMLTARRQFPAYTELQHLKIAASGYNCGMTAAIQGAKAGDSDAATTGHNYGRDVMTRMAFFEAFIQENG